MKALSVYKLPGFLVLMVRLNAPLWAHWKATPPDYVLWSVLSSRNMPITEKMGELIVTLIRYLKVKWAPSLAPILVWTGTASAATIGTSPWFLGTET